MSILQNMNKIIGSTRKSKRVGRGHGSGKGAHTVGKGQKGQKSRKGHNVPNWFEGGQYPMTRRMPYNRGFVRHTKGSTFFFNISDLQTLVEQFDLINPDLLIEQEYLSKLGKNDKVKILGAGGISKAVNFQGFTYTDIAKDKIEKSGGTAN